MKVQETTLGAVASNIQTGPFGSQLHSSDYSDEGTPVIMPQDIVDWKISEQKIARVSEEHVQRLQRHKTNEGDIIYPRRGDLAKCAYITDNETDWLCGTGCLKVTIDEARANSKYVYYHLQQPYSTSCIELATVGSTMPNLNTSILSKVKLRLPSIDIQNKVVDILSQYDELIEVNRRRIAILEEMAMRTYREWFVFFRFPGHESTEFVNGLPKGWKYRSVTDILQILYGKDHKLVYDGLFPIYGSGGIMRYGNEYLYEGESVLIPRKGTLNNIILADGKFWCIDTMFYSIPKIPKICKLAFFQLKAFDMEVFNSGTALPSMTIKILSCLKLLVPDEKYRTLFEQSISAIFNELTYLKKLNVTLQQMRDRLLPQLMSGQLEVTP